MSDEECALPAIHNSLILQLKHIEENPQNPRTQYDLIYGLDDLKSSIESLGVLEPILVRRHPEKDGILQVLAGSRRVEACRQLGRKTIPAVLIENLEEGQDFQITLAENQVRRKVIPLREAELIAQALQRQGATKAALARALGRSERWVARRANLSNLSEDARGILAKHHLEWPADWLEEIALIGPSYQKDFLLGSARKQLKVIHSLPELRSLVASTLHILRTAPWDVEATDLSKDGRACIGCSNSSAADPDLFAPDIRKPEHVLCRDLGCWNEKLEKHLDRRVKEARRTHGAELFLVADPGAHARREGPVSIENQPVRSGHDFDNCPKSKGGRPGLFISGPKMGKIIWIREKEEKTLRKLEKGDTMSLEQKEARLEMRRWKHLIRQFRKAVEELLPRKAELSCAHVLQLVGAYGVSPFETWMADAVKQREQILDLEDDDLISHVWIMVQERLDAILESLEHTDSTEARTEAMALCRFLKLPWMAWREDALRKIPRPKSWPAENTKETC